MRSAGADCAAWRWACRLPRYCQLRIALFAASPLRLAVGNDVFQNIRVARRLTMPVSFGVSHSSADARRWGVVVWSPEFAWWMVAEH